jgi:hypothetical protein
MSLVKRLVRQLEERGLSVGPGPAPGQLVLLGPAKEKTPEVMAAVKAFKPELLEIYGVRAAPDLPADDARPDAVAQPETPADPQRVPRT